MDLWNTLQNTIKTRLVEDARYNVSIPIRKKWEEGFDPIILLTDGLKTEDGVEAAGCG